MPDLSVRLAAAALAAAATWQLVSSYQRALRGRALVRRIHGAPPEPASDLPGGLWVADLAAWLAKARVRLPGGLTERWCRTGEGTALARQIVIAQLGGRMDAVGLLTAKLALGVLFGLAAVVAASGSFTVVWFAAMVAAGYLLPNHVIGRLVEERQSALKRELPDALDILVIGLRAGLSFDRVLRLYVERFEGALAQALRDVLTRIDLGQPRRKALAELALAGVDDLDQVAAAVTQAERLGTPLAHVLESQAHGIRRRQFQRIKEQSGKAPVKMLFPLAGLVLPALFLVLLGPVAIRLLAGE